MQRKYIVNSCTIRHLTLSLLSSFMIFKECSAVVSWFLLSWWCIFLHVQKLCIICRTTFWTVLFLLRATFNFYFFRQNITHLKRIGNESSINERLRNHSMSCNIKKFGISYTKGSSSWSNSTFIFPTVTIFSGLMGQWLIE